MKSKIDSYVDFMEDHMNRHLRENMRPIGLDSELDITLRGLEVVRGRIEFPMARLEELALACRREFLEEEELLLEILNSAVNQGML
jgi:hypothetical protein